MRRRLLALVLSFGPLSFVPILAQDVKPTLTLRTTTGATRFHLGERISLTLTLTGPGNGKYSIDTASYDRSGRLNIDTFDASPNDGWADPLATYFSQGAFDGGGLRGAEVLSPKPVSFLVDVNEHIRFDRPGAYTITATSNRVGTPSKDSSLPGEPFLSLVSNPIQIEILPATPEWQAQKLRSILAVLAVPFKAKRFEALPAERTNAIADLRFLNSPASIELLASYLREGDSDEPNNLKWAAAFGLAGVPNSMRDIALHAMSRQLEDPAFPVTEFFLTVMACLEPAPHSTKWEFLAANRPGFRPAWQIALSDLPRKQGPALAVTADTLFSNTPDGEDSEVKARLAAAVAKASPCCRSIAKSGTCNTTGKT